MNSGTNLQLKGVCFHVVVIFVMGATGVVGTGKCDTPIACDVKLSHGINNQ